jgi:hypothetical protein
MAHIPEPPITRGLNCAIVKRLSLEIRLMMRGETAATAEFILEFLPAHKPAESERVARARA